ncbi:MAG TPA: hypothetical protein VN361_02430 [Oxalicibacterium sp.]|nr:hypothetical protein [Oxalicibacterium sp.]
MTTNAEALPDNAKADACAYLLHMLLQRLETGHPGLINDMLRGALADRNAYESKSTPNGNVVAVFDEAISLLELANVQMNNARS